MRVAAWAALFCLVLIPSAQAASFDCGKASTFVEKAICTDKQLSGLDDQLAGLYKAGRAAAANSATLEADQKAWLEALVHQTEERIKFSINATYGQNTGEMSGEIPLTGASAKYFDKDLDCTLSFKFAAEKLDLAQDGTCGMGLNVSASGTYRRVSTVPPQFDE